tara:strand:- start:16 stop:480 length:465 start_codon:yes stop_codon:yes gene_type:complete
MKRKIKNIALVLGLIGSLNLPGCFTGSVRTYNPSNSYQSVNSSLSNIEEALDNAFTCSGGFEVTPNELKCVKTNIEMHYRLGPGVHTQHRYRNNLSWAHVKEVFMKENNGFLGCSVGINSHDGSSNEFFFTNCNTSVNFMEAVVSYTGAKFINK